MTAKKKGTTKKSPEKPKEEEQQSPQAKGNEPLDGDSPEVKDADSTEQGAAGEDKEVSGSESPVLTQGVDLETHSKLQTDFENVSSELTKANEELAQARAQLDNLKTVETPKESEDAEDAPDDEDENVSKLVQVIRNMDDDYIRYFFSGCKINIAELDKEDNKGVGTDTLLLLARNLIEAYAKEIRENNYHAQPQIAIAKIDDAIRAITYGV